MAAIGTIRKYSGLLIAIIGVALAAFVLGDFGKSLGSGGRSEDLAEIDGEKITYMEFENLVDQQAELYKQNTQKDRVTQEEMYRIRKQTWEMILQETIMEDEYDELGITVTKAELDDLIRGNNPHPYIVRNFTNPNTGQFDQQRVISIWNNFDKLEKEAQQQIINLEEQIKKDRLTTKYYNLISKGYYLPSEIAKKDYKAANDVYRYAFTIYPYSKLADTAVNITDKDYEEFYEENKIRYDQEKSRAIEYVIFDVKPSPEDVAKIEKEVAEIEKEFKAVPIDNIVNYVNRISDVRYDSTFFKEGELPINIDSIMFNAPIGTMVGPYEEEETYTLARLVDIQNRPDSIKASHILIAYQGAFNAQQSNITRTKKQAEKLADSLLNVAKNSLTPFDTLAKKFSDDPSAAQNNGDLGWFADGTMVYPFNQACIENEVGDIVKIQSRFGYHIINITGKKEPVKKARVAFVKRYNEPSEETFQNVYSKASKFAGENKTLEEFREAITKQGLNKRTSDYLREMDNRIPGLENPREIIRWVFEEERKVGDVSIAFDLQNQYIVAAVKDIRKKGVPELIKIKEQIKPQVVKRKKAQVLKEKINNKIKEGANLKEIASEFNLEIDTVKRGTFQSPNIPKVGREINVVGYIAGMEKGEMSKAIEGNRGVFVVTLNDKIDAPEIENHEATKKNAARRFQQRVNYAAYKALQDCKEIEDNRGQFY